MVASSAESRKVAKKFYAKQFGADTFAGSITQMRGIEGRLMRKTYADQAKRSGVNGFKRDTKGTDAVNIALNVCNSFMYGLCASVTQSLAMSPALGIIHRGNARSFLFDLADWYKPLVVLPVAFGMADVPPDEVAREAIHRMRVEVINRRLMDDLFNTLTEIFEPYTPERDDDRLIGSRDEVDGHINYGAQL